MARATVYYQFKSKSGLLEAVCDDLGETAGLAKGLFEAFSDPDPHATVAGVVTAFGRFWQVDRTVMRRLRSLAALEPEVRAVVEARDERRRAGLLAVVSRFPVDTAESVTLDGPDRARTLFALTGFETFDALAAPDQDLLEVAPTIVKLAGAVLRST